MDVFLNKKLGVRFTYKVRPSKDKKPYILVSNHASRMDYLYTAPAVLPHRLNYVVGYNEFYPERGDTMRWFHLTEELHRACGGRWR